MAERPILKSEREAAKQAQPEQAPNAQTPKRNVPRPIKKGDRKDTGESGEQPDPTQGHWTDSMDGRGKGGRKGGKGKGRGKGKGDARKAPVNPALMRGPRPTAKVEEPEPEETPTEETNVEANVEATETAETTAETPETTPEATAEATAEASGEKTEEETAAPPETPTEDKTEESA